MKNCSKKLTSRYLLIENAKTSIELMAMVKQACKTNIFYWLENFCWVHNPHKTPSQIPVYPYPFQKDLIFWLVDHIKNNKDGLIEKSREMTVTWSVLLVFQWLWQFGDSGNDYLLGSETADDVYKNGDPRALFSKLRYNLIRQPPYLLPIGFDINKHYGYMKLVNPVTESAIVGESNNLDFSRNSRQSAILYDEFAFWRHTDEFAWEAGSDTSKTKIAVSTANGKNNYFYKLRDKQIGNIDVLRLHWKLHPEKNDKWYKEQKKRRSKADLAREVDIDYSASVSNRAAEMWNPSIHILKESEWKYSPNVELQLACDFNINPMCWSVSESAKGEDITFKEYTEGTTVTESVIGKFVKDFRYHKNKIIHLYGDRSGHSGSTRSRSTDYDIIKRILRVNNWTVYDKTFIANPRQVEMSNCINKRLSDWENQGKAWEFILVTCKNLIDSMEQTERKDDGIISNGVEHHFQAFGYRVCMKYPISSKNVRVHKRG